MSNVLVVLTDKYPYGNRETFIESERVYWRVFDKVLICPVLVRSTDTIRNGFECSNDEKLICTKEDGLKLWTIIKGLNGAISFVDMITELHRTTTITDKKNAFAMMVFTNFRYKRIAKELEKYIEVGDNILFYSYWMFEPSLVGAGLKEHFFNSRFVTRAHGYDLYEERHLNNYIPFREMVLDRVEAIYTVSENGKEYLRQRYQHKYDFKISIERLGTKKLFDNETIMHKKNKAVIVSCSNLIMLKRVERIIESLKDIKTNVEWFHFGDGELFESLVDKSRVLPPNVEAHFMGHIPNKEVQRFYSKEYVDAFLSVSETEGVPVSIMEAQSYGIPVVATNVGGVSELVKNGKNGVLLNKDFSNEELLHAIHEVIKNAELYRKCAMETWQTKSNADMIYDNLFQRELIATTQAY